jgi:MoaA/NifB/PqqE/SkfB family radical SAM enzyme
MITIQDYVDEIKRASDAEWQKRGYDMNNAPTFSIMSGSKFYRVVTTSWGSQSVHCFVDRDGNIYKSASWKTPAKGIRGNINDAKKPLLGWDFYWRR